MTSYFIAIPAKLYMNEFLVDHGLVNHERIYSPTITPINMDFVLSKVAVGSPLVIISHSPIDDLPAHVDKLLNVVDFVIDLFCLDDSTDTFKCRWVKRTNRKIKASLPNIIPTAVDRALERKKMEQRYAEFLDHTFGMESRS
jgi:hypothetical protein